MKTLQNKLDELQKPGDYFIDYDNYSFLLLEEGKVKNTAWAPNPQNGKSYEVEFNFNLYRTYENGDGTDTIELLR